jgi:hypothetical protein
MKTSEHFLLYIAQFFLEREMSQREIVEKIKTPIPSSIIFFFENYVFVKLYKKIQYNWIGHRWQYGTCALHAG